MGICDFCKNDKYGFYLELYFQGKICEMCDKCRYKKNIYTYDRCKNCDFHYDVDEKLYYCDKCDENINYICYRCNQIHKKMSHEQGEKISCIEIYDKENAHKCSNCTNHTNLTYYCDTCNFTLCEYCAYIHDTMFHIQ